MRSEVITVFDNQNGRVELHRNGEIVAEFGPMQSYVCTYEGREFMSFENLPEEMKFDLWEYFIDTVCYWFGDHLKSVLSYFQIKRVDNPVLSA